MICNMSAITQLKFKHIWLIRIINCLIVKAIEQNAQRNFQNFVLLFLIVLQLRLIQDLLLHESMLDQDLILESIF
jgi:hypothetical protein